MGAVPVPRRERKGLRAQVGLEASCRRGPGLYWQKRSPLAGVLLQLGGSLGVGRQGHSQISMLSSTMLGWEVQEESSFL